MAAFKKLNYSLLERSISHGSISHGAQWHIFQIYAHN